MSISNTYDCDGPACTETSVDGSGWVFTSIGMGMDAVSGALTTKYHGKHFHNEACLEAHVVAE